MECSFDEERQQAFLMPEARLCLALIVARIIFSALDRAACDAIEEADSLGGYTTKEKTVTIPKSGQGILYGETMMDDVPAMVMSAHFYEAASLRMDKCSLPPYGAPPGVEDLCRWPKPVFKFKSVSCTGNGICSYRSCCMPKEGGLDNMLEGVRIKASKQSFDLLRHGGCVERLFC